MNNQQDLSKIIGIQLYSITGILNPLFCVKGTLTDKKYEIVLKDEKNNIIGKYKADDSGNFIINISLNKKEKKIIFLLRKNSKIIEVFSIKNNLLRRVINKIKSIVKKITFKFKNVFRILHKGIRFAWKEYHFLIPPALWPKYFRLFLNKLHGDNLFYDPFNVFEYNEWLKNNTTITEYKKMKYEPLISILVPVYNVKKQVLSECLDSVLNQNYTNFEVCLVDDCSTLPETKETLEDYCNKDKRIRVKYRTKNGHISATTNDALKMAKGEFIALLDNDDLLTKDALLENILLLNDNKKLDFIYSDEDKLNLKGEFCDPHFKPDWSPDTLLSLNYICHFAVIRKKMVDKVGGFEIGLEGAQDHDLFLKISEVTNNISHIPKILYHWRMVPGSTSMNIKNKDYATDKGKIAIENALKRRNILGHVEKDEISTYYKVIYDVVKKPLVSIIIPTRDYVDILKTCVDSIYEKTNYDNFEIIVANNDSKEKETFNFFNKYKKKYSNFHVVDCIMEFNYSKINNVAIKKSKGDYIILLNNDTEVITPEWIDIMLGYAMQKHIGTVGVKLLYPDTTVQHCGVLLGLGGVASHAYLTEKRSALGMYGRLRVPYNYGANTAACLMIDRKKLAKVNYLNEDLMVAYNDIDLNLKMLNLGLYNVTLPMVELYHHESKSRGLDTTNEKYKRFLKEETYMFEKWSDILLNDPFYNKNFSLRCWFELEKGERILPDETKKILNK